MCLNVKPSFRDARLAAQHILDVGGSRTQLVGLAHRQPLARLGLDMVDETGQVAARLGSVVGRKVGLHRLQLGVKSRLQASGEMEAVDQVDM